MKNNYFTKALLLTFFLLMVVQVIVSNRLSTAGAKIATIEEEIKKIEEENELLQKEIASASSLLTLQERARLLGFIKTTSTFNLFEELPVASRREFTP